MDAEKPVDVEKRVAQLLAAPRGLWFLASAAAVNHRWMGYVGGQLPEHFGFEQLDQQSRDTEWKLVDRALTILRDWQWGGMESWVERLRSRESELRPIAEEFVRDASGAWWWWEPLRRDRQTWLAWGDGALQPQSSYQPDFRDHRLESTKPRSATWTSSWVGGVLSTWLYQGWEGLGDLPLRVWWLRPDPAARIYEIHEPDDWVRLCSRYPRDATELYGQRALWGGPDGAFITPGWPAVAKDWDAVHLSMAGLLTASGIPLEVPGIGRTYLEGWHTESTVWLRWSFTEANRLPDWTDPLPMGAEMHGVPRKARDLRLKKLSPEAQRSSGPSSSPSRSSSIVAR